MGLLWALHDVKQQPWILYPLVTHRTPLSTVTTKNVSRYCPTSLGKQNCPSLRTTDDWKKFPMKCQSHAKLKGSLCISYSKITQKGLWICPMPLSLMKLQLQILPTLTHCPNTRDQIIFLDQYHSQENIYLHRWMKTIEYNIYIYQTSFIFQCFINSHFSVYSFSCGFLMLSGTSLQVGRGGKVRKCILNIVSISFNL